MVKIMVKTFEIITPRTRSIKTKLINWTFEIITPWTRSIKKKLINWIKLKLWLSKRIKTQATDWEKIFEKDTSDKGLYPIYAKNS